MKLVTLTQSTEELSELIPLLRELYFDSTLEMLCLVNSEAEARILANPVTHRQLREYCQTPIELDESLKDKALVEAARRSLLEERPDLILWPTRTFLKGALHSIVQLCGIGEYQLGDQAETSLAVIIENLKNVVLRSAPVSPGGVTTLEFLQPHWSKIAEHIQSPCLLQTTPQIAQVCREKFPHMEFHEEASQDLYPTALSLLGLSFSEEPQADIQRIRKLSKNLLSLEPVNSPIRGARYNFCYGLYDSEFALAAPEFDLKTALGEAHFTEIWDNRTGQAGAESPPHPDEKYPAFATTWPAEKREWTAKYEVPPSTNLNIVFCDSGNVAGSVLHHTHAINKFTHSQAWAVANDPHPFIGPQSNQERVFFVQGQTKIDSKLQDILEKADVVVFFEDDDETSSNWPFPLADILKDTPIVHLYIGYRVHSRTPRLARPGRTVLTPLPHVLRMYPDSKFYAGFPPLSLLEEELKPPLSASDGVCRFLHTPSLPHWTTSHYPYHKDTESYIRTARLLKKRHGNKVEFHQVGGWSHQEILRARQQCDVTFNQLRGFHGLSGDEAMFLSRPCVQTFDQLNINRHLEYWGLDVDFPWLNCNRDTLAEIFEKLIESPEQRRAIGEQSREFMLKFFSPQKGILPLLYHCYRAVLGGKPGRGPS